LLYSIGFQLDTKNLKVTLGIGKINGVALIVPEILETLPNMKSYGLSQMKLHILIQPH